MSTTEILERIVAVLPDQIELEAEAIWCPRDGGDGSEGEAQAVILKEGKRYAISLEELP